MALLSFIGQRIGIMDDAGSFLREILLKAVCIEDIQPISNVFWLK